MFKVVAILASLALAQAAHPLLGYGLGYHGLGYHGHGPLHSAAIPAVNHPGAPVVKTGHALGYGLGYGHGFGYGFHEHDHEQPFLSCYEAHDDGGLKNSIAVNIKPRMYGYGLAGFGAGHMGLEATINVFSEDGGDVVISFTEKSNALGSGTCKGEDYGHYLGLSKSDYDDSVVDHKYGHGFGAYGGYGFGYGYGHGHYEVVAPSVAKTTIAANMMASFHIDHLEGFTSLAQLAGRGVMVCAKDNVKSDDHGHWYCDSDGSDVSFPCCNLHFSGSGDSLDADGSRHDTS